MDREGGVRAGTQPEKEGWQVVKEQGSLIRSLGLIRGLPVSSGGKELSSLWFYGPKQGVILLPPTCL